jgi:hypothetical protein
MSGLVGARATIDPAALRQCADLLLPVSPGRRIGLALIHSHFELHDGEVMVETVDAESRVCTVRPVRIDSVPAEAELIPTIWELGPEGSDPVAVQYCYRPRNSQFHMR